MSVTSIHPDFDASDADVTFQSSDGVQLRIHRKYLEANTGAFPGSEFDAHGEGTHLTEDSATLAILFRFVYPQKHPTLQDADFKTLAAVAEAVEKYQVFSAMNTCEMRLRRFVPEHPVEILVHAVKHDYRELREDTFPYFARSSFGEVAAILPDTYIRPWIQYTEAWRSIFAKARKMTQKWPKTTTNCSRPPYSMYRCWTCVGACREWLQTLEEMGSLPRLQDEVNTLITSYGALAHSGHPHCGACNDRTECLREVAKVVADGMAAIPVFTHFLEGKTWSMP